MIEYEVIYSKRRTVGITVTDDLRVVVRAPMRMSRRRIDATVAANEGWINSSLEQVRKRREQYPELTEAEIVRLKRAAKEYIPQRVEYFSRLTGLTPTAVKINSAKKRFGSCSDKNSINFSYRLMRYPPEAIDYVVLHELCHIAEHNHSAAFYSLIERYMPDYKQREKILK